jgi:type IV pilus assembly protein PilM
VARQGRVLFFKLIDLAGATFNQAVATRLNLSVSEAGELRRSLRQQGSGDAAPEQLFGSSRRENIERAVAEATRGVAGDLAREIGLCLRYFSVTFRGRRPETVALDGGGADEPQLVKALAEEANVTAQPLTSLLRLESRNASCIAEDEQGHWAVALGLASRSNAAAARRKVA